MSLDYYILEGQRVVAADRDAWARWFETADRHVAKDTIGGAWVSTVFLGLDHNFLPGGRPLLFETMVFETEGPMIEHYTERYSTWAEAEAGHARIVTMVALAMGEELPAR